MKAGDQAGVEMTTHGEFMLISTGCSAWAEHEVGATPLRDALTKGNDVSPAAYAARLSGRDEECRVLYVLERKRLRVTQDDLVLQSEGEGDERLTAIHFGAGSQSRIASLLGQAREMRRIVFGAWDSAGFFFCTSGERFGDKLTRFHGAICAGNGILAGSFWQGSRSQHSGIVIARSDLMRPEHHAMARAAQRQFESDVKLELLSKAAEIKAASRKRGVTLLAVWPVWSQGAGTDVLYGINPGFGVKAVYGGPYTAQALMDWIESGADYQLAPRRFAEESTA